MLQWTIPTSIPNFVVHANWLVATHRTMHRLSRARFPRIFQSQTILVTSPLTRNTFILRSYSSNPNEQDTKLPPHYHITHPDLRAYDPLIDQHVSHVFPPNAKTPYTNKVTIRNETEDGLSVFQAERRRIAEFGSAADPDFNPWEDMEGEKEEQDSSEVNMKSHLPLSPSQYNNLFQFPLVSRRITKQTGKGKIHRMYHLIVVGDGNGLVGYGEGKDLDDNSKAVEKAFVQAVRNMDYVERFEKRTIFGDMHTKMGSTQIILRPRPVGFGLHCNPNIHQVLKAAGIKDISAKVWGSRNPINVIKALFRMLHSGNAPLYMGDGVGGRGRRTNKGEPILSREALERARGRRLVDLRT